jgi:hypothetical protein
VQPRILASAAALAGNARPTPEIFALLVVVDVQVVEACKEAVGAQVVAACTEAVDVQVAVVEGDADDWEAQPFSDKIGKKSHAWGRCSITHA